MSRRIRRLSIASAGVLAAAGLATGASGALSGSGEESPEVRFVVNEDSKGGAQHDGDCPGKDGSDGSGSSPSGASDPASAL